jgi:nitroreductase
MEYGDLLKYRKSTRKFTERQITEKELSEILVAAKRAPVGSNLYKDIYLTVVQNREILNKLSQAAAKRFENKAIVKKIAGEYKPEQAEKAYDPFYGAPTVIFVSHRNQTIQPGIEFSNVACVTYSMHLAATDLGLGSVFMWFALESMREIPELDNSYLLNLPDDFAPLIGIAIGYPAEQLTMRELKTDKIAVNYI